MIQLVQSQYPDATSSTSASCDVADRWIDRRHDMVVPL